MAQRTVVSFGSPRATVGFSSNSVPHFPTFLSPPRCLQRRTQNEREKCLHSSELTPGYHLPNPCSLPASSTQKGQVTCSDSNSKSWPGWAQGPLCGAHL